MQFIYGILGMGLAYVIVKYREQIVEMTGKFSWAEKYLGRGGTYNAYVLLGIIIFIISFLFFIGEEELLFGNAGKYV